MRPGGGDGAKAMAQEGGRRVDHLALTAAAAGGKNWLNMWCGEMGGKGSEGTCRR